MADDKPRSKLTWTQVGILRGEPRRGRRGLPAVQISIADQPPTRLSIGIGVEQDGQFRPTPFMDPRDLYEYVRLIIAAGKAVAQSVLASTLRATELGRLLFNEQEPLRSEETTPEHDPPALPPKPAPKASAPKASGPLRATLGDMLKAKTVKKE